LKATRVKVFIEPIRKGRERGLCRTDYDQEVLQRNLKVMDSTAIPLCMDNGMPIWVLNDGGERQHKARGAKGIGRIQGYDG